jgi:hypothetical protein
MTAMRLAPRMPKLTAPCPLIAEKCFSIGGLNWSKLAKTVSRHKYPVGTTVTVSRLAPVLGLRGGKQELAAGL